MQAIPLVNVIRGDKLESVHVGCFAVIQDGKVIHSGGDMDQLYYFRSAAKPLQTLPTLLTGTAEQFKLTADELALTCASHHGETMHVDRVRTLLKRGGLTEDHLQCGPAWPSNEASKEKAISNDKEKRRIYHNCSGKHTGMLLNCLHNNWPLDSYLDFDHPLQQQILSHIATFSGVDESDIHMGVDGCGAPVFYLTVTAMAQVFSHFAKPPVDWNSSLRDACQRICDAMAAHPLLMGGTTDFCSALMGTGQGRWVNKGGAEGVYGVGIRDSGIGLALKCLDGHKRGRNAAVVALLDQLGVLTDADRTALHPHSHMTILNSQGKTVGGIDPVVQLK